MAASAVDFEMKVARLGHEAGMTAPFPEEALTALPLRPGCRPGSDKRLPKGDPLHPAFEHAHREQYSLSGNVPPRPLLARRHETGAGLSVVSSGEEALHQPLPHRLRQHVERLACVRAGSDGRSGFGAGVVPQEERERPPAQPQ